MLIPAEGFRGKNESRNHFKAMNAWPPRSASARAAQSSLTRASRSAGTAADSFSLIIEESPRSATRRARDLALEGHRSLVQCVQSRCEPRLLPATKLSADAFRRLLRPFSLHSSTIAWYPGGARKRSARTKPGILRKCEFAQGFFNNLFCVRNTQIAYVYAALRSPIRLHELSPYRASLACPFSRCALMKSNPGNDGAFSAGDRSPIWL